MTLFIDPGKTGGAIVVNRLGQVFTVEFGSVEQVAHDLLNISEVVDHAYIEDIHASGQMVPKQSFEFGRNLGHWEGIPAGLETHEITRIKPYAWQKPMGVPRGLDYGKRKTWLYRKSVGLVGKKLTSRALADAWLIAHHCRKACPQLDQMFDALMKNS